MNRKELTQRAEHALTELATQLASGKSEQLTKHLAAMARFATYSFGNVSLIVSQRPDATLVAGYQAWKKLGRQVKRGEKAIGIRAPLVFKDSDSAKEESVVKGFKVAHVFDVSQTEGDPLPEPASVEGNPKSATEQLRCYVESLGICLEFDAAIYPAEGRSHGGKITLVPGLSPAAEFAVLAHELGHELLEHRHGTSSKTVRETEAEAVAFAVCSAFGLNAKEAAADYIQLYDGTKETLVESLERVQRVVVNVVRGMDEQLKREQTTRHHLAIDLAGVLEKLGDSEQQATFQDALRDAIHERNALRVAAHIDELRLCCRANYDQCFRLAKELTGIESSEWDGLLYEADHAETQVREKECKLEL